VRRFLGLVSLSLALSLLVGIRTATADGPADSLGSVSYDFGNGPEPAYQATLSSDSLSDYTITITVFVTPPSASEYQIGQSSASRATTPTGPISTGYRGPAGEVPPDSLIRAHFESRTIAGALVYANDRWLQLP